MNNNNCCNKCLGSARDVGIEYLCKDIDCDCHTVKATQPKQEWEITLKQHFEANMLDGDKVEDCGKAILDAQCVWDYIKDYMPELLSSQLSLSNKELAGRIEGLIAQMLKEFVNTPLDKRKNGWDILIDFKERFLLLNQEATPPPPIKERKE